MTVRLLTEEQKDQLVGQTYDGVQFFNPTQDADGNWFISNEEVAQCVNFDWVSSLPEIEYKPVVVEMPSAPSAE
jgi:hypothetical protein